MLLATVLVATGCSKKEAAAGPGGPGGRRGGMQFPVEVEAVRSQNVEYTVQAVGSVDAFERVEVTARVPGAVERVRFSEGQLVQTGQVLVEIEPERYRLAVNAAEANYQQAVAELSEGQAGLARRQAANAKNPGLIRGEEMATWETKVQTAAARVSQQMAALQQARLNLRDALVTAPVPGLIQTRTVQTGQYVPTGTVLATLLRRDPLLLRFQVPENNSSALRSGMRALFLVSDDPRRFSARISHIAASADEASRMVAVTAQVDDPNRAVLKPGAFAQVSVPIGSAPNAPVIPQTAIRPSERGFLAYVVEGNVAKERVLNLGMRTADGRVEVKTGLKPGEMLVVRGVEALRDGAPVRVAGTQERPNQEQMKVRPAG
jgi:multidrug efflux system membrane fusion protein